MKCKICSAETTKLFKEKVLGKYDVQYYQCPKCLFVQTEKEYWLKEAYKTSMNINDTGVMSRSVFLALRTSVLLTFLFNKKGKFIDYAGGWGVLTRLMRDIGFDFYWYDPYTKNEMARGFEANLKDKYEALTVFEGFEHFQDPNGELKKLLKLSDTIIFSTTLVPKPTPEPGEWRYYGFNHGQHIALYSKQSLEEMAKKHECSYYTDGEYFHIITRRHFPKLVLRVLLSKFSLLFFPLVFLLNKSRTLSDHDKMVQG